MKIRVTSVIWREVDEKMGDFPVKLEEALAPFFVGEDFDGNIDQLAIIYVQARDEGEVEAFLKKWEGKTRYKSVYTGEIVDSIGFVVFIDAMILLETPDVERPRYLLDICVNQMRQKQLKRTIKGFRFDAFKVFLIDRLQTLDVTKLGPH